MSKHNFTDVRVPIEEDNVSIRRIEELCIKCGLCKQVCKNDMAVSGYYDLEKTNDKAICINCGQCSVVCPMNSITEVYNYNDVKNAIKDGNKIVIVSTSPSCRVALGDEFGLKRGEFVEGKMVSALRKLGFDYVLDTNFSADLTIMEEANELIERIKSNKNLPQFTSCCPAWVKFVETFHPDLIPNLSTAKSPIAMQGVTVKTYFAEQKKLNPKQIVHVALTPCTAKKFEIKRPEFNTSGKLVNDETIRDTDYVITTRELAKWLKEDNINFSELKDEKFDSLMSEYTGGGAIFGKTGGVMESALRTAGYLLTNKPVDFSSIKNSSVRGIEGVRKAEIKIGDYVVKVAVVNGTANANELIKQIKSGEESFDFVEVMACKGGCIGGGGQPKVFENSNELKESRISALYEKDNNSKLKSSYENSEIQKVYSNFYGKPLSEKAEELLHTSYVDRSSDLGVNNSTIENERYICQMCGYEHKGKLEDDFICPVCSVTKEFFIKL